MRAVNGSGGGRLAPIVVAALACVGGCGAGGAGDDSPARDEATATAGPTMMHQESGTSALLQAVSAIDDDVVWVSGHEATYARTTDGGRTWHAAVMADADSLQFRDVHAVDARTAYLLSAGPGDLSRIYKTTDAGRSWTLQFRNEDPDAFFDCMDFWDERRGVAFSDAVEGEFVIITTDDGGESWTRVPPASVPDAPPEGGGGFAASGTCVVAGPDGRAWIGTGASSEARVLRTDDYGRSWRVFDTPIVAGEAAGIFSLVFRDAENGVALGGDLGRAEAVLDSTVAITRDGGRSWTLGGPLAFAGAAYGASYVRGAASPVVVAVGPAGLAYSPDEGRTWLRADTLSYWAVGFAPDSPADSAATDTARAARGVGWAVGPEGRIVKLEWR